MAEMTTNHNHSMNHGKQGDYIMIMPSIMATMPGNMTAMPFS